MADLSTFAVTQRWPAEHPDRLQLYSVNTPNGVKVSIMLEEIGLAYEPHRIDFASEQQRMPEFLSLNPNGKIRRSSTPPGPAVDRSRFSRAARSCCTLRTSRGG